MSCSNEETIVEKKQLQLRANEGRWYRQGVPFNGVAQTKNAAGVDVELTRFRNGKKDGRSQTFFNDKTQKRHTYYKENRKEGVEKVWFSNGQLAAETTSYNGKLHGIQRYWHPNGVMAKQRTMDKGQENGMQHAWLNDGTLYYNYEARGGRRFGLKRSNLCYQLKNEQAQL